MVYLQVGFLCLWRLITNKKVSMTLQTNYTVTFHSVGLMPSCSAAGNPACGHCVSITLTSHKCHGILNYHQLFVQQLVQANNKENIKVPHYWPFVKGNPLVVNPDCDSHTTLSVGYLSMNLFPLGSSALIVHPILIRSAVILMIMLTSLMSIQSICDVHKHDCFVMSQRFHNCPCQLYLNDCLPETSKILWIHGWAMIN